MAITLDGSNGILSPDFEPSSSTTPTNGLFLPAANALGFATNSTERLRLDASGNLGLGATPSAWDSGYAILQAGSNGSAFGGRSAANTAYMMSNSVRSGSAWKYINTAATAQFQIENGAFYWFTAPSGTAGNAISFTQAMTLDASGNLGIGTTSPTRDAGTASIGVSGGSSKAASIDIYGPTGSSGRNYAIYTSGTPNNGLQFYDLTAGAERARIASSGSFLVGTTTNPNNAAVYIVGGAANQLMVEGNEADIWLKSTGPNKIWRILGSTGGTTHQFRIYDESGGGVNRLTISSTGVVTINNLSGTGSRTVTADASGNLSAASDSSLKQEDAQADIPGLAEILRLTPRAYKWLSDIEIRGDEAATEIGFFADEAAPIIPSAAPKCEDGLYGFYDRAVTAALVKAIQELTARLEALEAK